MTGTLLPEIFEYLRGIVLGNIYIDDISRKINGKLICDNIVTLLYIK
jgi:hypothetical protein